MCTRTPTLMSSALYMEQLSAQYKHLRQRAAADARNRDCCLAVCCPRLRFSRNRACSTVHRLICPTRVAADEVVVAEAAEELPLSDRQLVQCPPEVERPPWDCAEAAEVGPRVWQGLAGCPLLVLLISKSVGAIASRRLNRRPRREYVAQRVQAANVGPALLG